MDRQLVLIMCLHERFETSSHYAELSGLKTAVFAQINTKRIDRCCEDVKAGGCMNV